MRTVDETIPAPASGGDDLEALPRVAPEAYRLGEEIARGGMGRIVAARDRRLRRPVALKLLAEPQGGLRRRFEREALVTARLQHPAIVPVYEAGELASGEPFYAMRLVQGRSFDRVIARARTLKERLALLPHVIAVVDALAYAHSRRVLHRDLKPANVLVGAFGETVVIDWGLAKDLDEAGDGSLSGAGSPGSVSPAARADGARPASDASGDTVAGSVLGTPSYMPPEQAAGRPVDTRADVYALGALLYHLLGGQPPYAGRTSAEVLARVVSEPAPSLVDLAPDVPADLLAIVEKAMARAPDERYGDAGELAEELRRFQTGQLVAAHTYTTAERLARWLRRHRAAVVAALAALLALLATGAISMRRVLRERDRAEHARGVSERATAEADRARALAEDRADEMVVAQARAAVERDPTEALAWLKRLNPGSRQWSAARLVAADARRRGVARLFAAGPDVRAVALSPDGKRLASADAGAVRLWDVASGRSREIAPQRDVTALVFGDGGRLLVALGDELAFYGVDSGLVTRPPVGLVQSLALAPDARTLAVLDGDGALSVWDLASLAHRAVDRGLADRSPLIYSADSSRLAVETATGIRVHDLAGGGRRDVRIPEPAGWTLSPDGRTVVARGAAADLRAYDVATGRAGPRLLAERTLAPIFGPGGKTLAATVGPLLDRVAILDLEAGRARVLPVGRRAAERIAFTPDGRHLLTSGGDPVLRLWEPRAERTAELRGHVRPVAAIDLSADGRWLASAGDGVRLWDLASLGEVVQGPPDAAPRATLSRSLDRAAASAEGNRAVLVDVAGRGWRTFEDARAVALSSDGRRAAFVTGAGVQVVDASSGQRAALLAAPAGEIAALALSSDGRRLAAVGSAGWIWDLAAGPPAGGPTAPAPTAPAPTALAPTALPGVTGGDAAWFTNRDDRLLVTSPAGLQVVDLATGAVRTLPGPEPLAGYTLLEDGRTLVARGRRAVYGVDLTSGTVRVIASGDVDVTAVTASRDGRWIVTGGRDGVVRHHGEDAPAPFAAHDGDVLAVRLSPDGLTIATVGADQTLRLWDRGTGFAEQLPVTLPYELHVWRDTPEGPRETTWYASPEACPVVALEFSPDGRRLAAFVWDSTLYLFDVLPPDEPTLRTWLDRATPARLDDRHRLLPE